MIDFVGKRKIFFIISIALVAVTLLGSLFLGLNLDIQYKGGTMLTYSYTGDINKDDFLSKVQEVVGGSAAIQESSDLATGSTNLVVSLASTSGLSADKQVELTRENTDFAPDFLCGRCFLCSGVDSAQLSNAGPLVVVQGVAVLVHRDGRIGVAQQPGERHHVHPLLQ